MRPAAPVRGTLAVLALICTLAPAAGPAAAQAAMSFGGDGQDTGQPVEVTADNLSVQNDGAHAVMTGSVVIAQGEMRLAADRVEVDYAEGQISKMVATGNVTLVQGADAAEAKSADYDVARGTVILEGDVLVTQGPSSVLADRATVNLATGDAVMEGRVRSVLTGQ